MTTFFAPPFRCELACKAKQCDNIACQVWFLRWARLREYRP